MLSRRRGAYSSRAPEAACIAKGRAKIPYEFGSKVGGAMTLVRFSNYLKLEFGASGSLSDLLDPYSLGVRLPSDPCGRQ